MRRLALACLLLFAGCERPDAVLPTPSPATASATPLPSGVIDPRSLIQEATHLGSIVIRVDKVTVKLTTMSDFTKGAVGARISPVQAIWAVAVLGEIRIDSLMDLPHARCAVFAYDAATGDARGMQAGGAQLCDPYFE